jgi:hypothetical protein
MTEKQLIELMKEYRQTVYELVSIDGKTLEELIKITNSKTFREAIDKAIRFTLLHDKDSVQEALK